MASKPNKRAKFNRLTKAKSTIRHALLDEFVKRKMAMPYFAESILIEREETLKFLDVLRPLVTQPFTLVSARKLKKAIDALQSMVYVNGWVEGYARCVHDACGYGPKGDKVLTSFLVGELKEQLKSKPSK